jgi:aquaporin Z
MKYLYEFIGTFFLVFTIGMTVVEPNAAGNFAPVAIGSVLAVMIYAGGHISGGHYNPAVSLAVYLRGKLSKKDLGIYWIAQVLAATVGAATTLYFKGTQNPVAQNLDVSQALLAEFLFAFALCFVVLNVATAKATSNNSFYGLAIGFTVLCGAYAVGAISGAAFNPAVACGIAAMNLINYSSLWIYVVANFAGAIAAAYIFNAAHTNK